MTTLLFSWEEATSPLEAISTSNTNRRGYIQAATQNEIIFNNICIFLCCIMLWVDKKIPVIGEVLFSQQTSLTFIDSLSFVFRCIGFCHRC